MLPTQAIKPDPSVVAAGGNSKDKDVSASSLEANFSAYFSMMVAAMPSLQTGAPVPVQAAPASASPARPVDDAKQNPQNTQDANQTAATDQADGAAQAAASASAQTQAGAAQSSQQAGAAATGAQADPGQASSLTGAAKTAVTASGPGGYAAPASAKPAPPDPAPQAGTAPAAAGSAAANAQDAMAQAYPGGKFQVQYDDGATATSKAPLTEFVNQIQMDPKSGGDPGGSLPASASALPSLPAALPAAAVDMAAALQSLQTPLAATTALLAPASPETGPAGGIGALSGNNAAAAQAVGAGALPGATGSVRVTPSTAAEATPTGEESLLSQVDGSIRFLVKNQDKSAEMQLHPESLGRVQINLKVEGTVVHAKVWASEAATVPILQDHRATLEASLKAQGLTLGSFDLQHGRKEQQATLPAPSGSAPISGQALTGAGQESPVSVTYAPARTSQIEYVA